MPAPSFALRIDRLAPSARFFSSCSACQSASVFCFSSASTAAASPVPFSVAGTSPSAPRGVSESATTPARRSSAACASPACSSRSSPTPLSSPQPLEACLSESLLVCQIESFPKETREERTSRQYGCVGRISRREDHGHEGLHGHHDAHHVLFNLSACSVSHVSKVNAPPPRSSVERPRLAPRPASRSWKAVGASAGLTLGPYNNRAYHARSRCCCHRDVRRVLHEWQAEGRRPWGRSLRACHGGQRSCRRGSPGPGAPPRGRCLSACVREGQLEGSTAVQIPRRSNRFCERRVSDGIGSENAAEGRTFDATLMMSNEQRVRDLASCS